MQWPSLLASDEEMVEANESYKPYSYIIWLDLVFLVRCNSNIAKLEQKLLKLNERPKIGAVSGNLFGGNEA